ncbi:MAG: hypothetical protein QGH23_00255 [Dehalococcoidia bacterium]|nr:hypothetical protein [Dehalococcoidia bacterium]
MTPPQHLLHPGYQGGGAKGLDEVAVGTGFLGWGKSRSFEADRRQDLQRLVDDAKATLGLPQEPMADRPQKPPQPPAGTSP